MATYSELKRFPRIRLGRRRLEFVVAKGAVLRVFLLTLSEVETVMGVLEPKATAVSPVGSVVSLPEPEMLTILFPVDFLPFVVKVFVFDSTAKNLAAPDGGSTFWLLTKRVGVPVISKMEEPFLGPSARCATVVTRVTGS